MYPLSKEAEFNLFFHIEIHISVIRGSGETSNEQKNKYGKDWCLSVTGVDLDLQSEIFVLKQMLYQV